MALVCKAISLKLAQEGVCFTTFFYACLSSWPLSWCLGLCGEIGLIVSSCPPTTYALTGVHLIYIKFNTWRLCWTFLELPSKVGHGMHVHDCFVAQDWHLGLVSGSIWFDKTYTLFLLNYQIGHDKSSLWEYPELLFNIFSLTYVLALWLFLEGSMEFDRPGEAGARVLSQQLLPCWPWSLGCSGDINPCLVGYSLLQPRENGSLHATSSTSFLIFGEPWGLDCLWVNP